MEINAFFQAVKLDELGLTNISQKNFPVIISQENKALFPFSQFQVALIGLRQNHFDESSSLIRKALYQLNSEVFTDEVCDLGNFVYGKGSADQNIEKLAHVLYHLLSRNCSPLIFGGPTYFIKAYYMAYEQFAKGVKLCCIDKDIAYHREDDHNVSYLNGIIDSEKAYLADLRLLGIQNHRQMPESLAWMEKSPFESMRLGEIKNTKRAVEPILRDSNIISFNLSALKGSEAPEAQSPGPNGLSGEDACLIARYAGISEKCSTFSINGLTSLDKGFYLSPKLIAEIIWYFLEGRTNRLSENPLTDENKFIRYALQLKHLHYPIYFFKSTITDRWWMSIDENGKILTPSTYDDYLIACQGEIPDNWWKAVQKRDFTTE